MDTIFAQATAAGKAGLAVVRISGPDAIASVAQMAGPLPRVGRTLRRLRDRVGALLDEGLVLIFPAGQSFTGEETVELHLHGGTAVVAGVLRSLGDQVGLRPAVAGEFTRRALENGRLDLAQVEGLADLIDAETEAQRRQAARVFTGALGDLAGRWRNALIRAAALIAVTIDFVDEDVPVDVVPEVSSLIATVVAEMRVELAGARIAERIRDGFEVAIVGLPNVGKSTLLNRLAQREAAITSEYAGTTRDVIEVRMDLDGLPVTLLDTAGLRTAEDPIEGMGIALGIKRAQAADLRIHLVSSGEAPILTPEADDLIIEAKADLRGSVGGVSGLTGLGVDRLIEQVTDRLRGRVASAGVAMRERHRLALAAGVENIEAAQKLLAGGPEVADLVAEELRVAVVEIDSLVGKIDVETILDEIFARFCIGK